MVRTILIGIDGSTHSLHALELSLTWARRFDAMLVGLGIVDAPSILQPEMMPLGAGHYKQQSDELQLERARTRVEQFLEQFALRCSQAGVAYKVLEDEGSPYEMILREAQRYDLIVLGKETYFAGEDEADATLTQVLRDSPRPVVAVPETSPGDSIVIAYDGSLQAARVLQAFQTSGMAQTGSVHVVSIGTDHVASATTADRAIEFLAFHGIQATRHVCDPTPSVGGALLDKAKELQAGLLVMGCFGQRTLREFFLGSVTNTVLKRMPLPLFLYH